MKPKTKPTTQPKAKTSKPPLRRSVDLSKLDDFAAEVVVPPPVDVKPTEDASQDKADLIKTIEPYPWENPALRKDYFSGMGVPLSEPYIVKLRFIAQQTMWSQRKFCMKKLEEAIDREIDRIRQALEQGTSLI